MPIVGDFVVSLPKETCLDFGETLRLIGRTTFIF
jgi:hypothetical protein